MLLLQERTYNKVLLYKVTKSLLEGLHDGVIISLDEPDDMDIEPDDENSYEIYSVEAHGDYTKEDTAANGCPNPADTIRDLKNLEHYRKTLVKES